MTHETQHMISHAFHAAHNTETGKKVIHNAAAGVAAVTAGVIGPAAAVVVAPVAILALVGWGVWRLFKD
jgi:hypothetical protein